MYLNYNILWIILGRWYNSGGGARQSNGIARRSGYSGRRRDRTVCNSNDNGATVGISEKTGKTVEGSGNTGTIVEN